MRRGWKRYWRAVSIATLTAAAAIVAITLVPLRASAQVDQRNELSLAGLRPGRSKLSLKLHFPGFGAPVKDSPGYDWLDTCDGRIIKIEGDEERTIRTITISVFGLRHGNCVNQNEEKLRAGLKTGRGLELGDTCGRVTQLYGKPESRSPSVQDAHKLELLFYSFDWAGEDVPQSMEISCDAGSGQVVEITLASSSL